MDKFPLPGAFSPPVSFADSPLVRGGPKNSLNRMAVLPPPRSPGRLIVSRETSSMQSPLYSERPERAFLIRSLASPLQPKPASLGFGLVFARGQEGDVPPSGGLLIGSGTKERTRLLHTEARQHRIQRKSRSNTAERQRAGERSTFLSFARAEQIWECLPVLRSGSGPAGPGIFGYFSSLKSTSPEGETSPLHSRIQNTLY